MTMSGEELRAAAQELVDDIDAGRMFMNKVLRVRAALAAPSTPEPSGLREAREFVDAYIPDTLTHPPSGVQMTGYTVLRDGDTHARFVHGVSDEARLVEFLRVALDGAAPSTEPALDADTLVVAMLEAVKAVALRHGINPTEFLDAANAAANAVRRLAESQPTEEAR